jgi:hypothetical protein
MFKFLRRLFESPQAQQARVTAELNEFIARQVYAKREGAELVLDAKGKPYWRKIEPECPFCGAKGVYAYDCTICFGEYAK